MKKKCFKCGDIKPLSDFYKHPQMGDGHLNKCKECSKKDSRERGYSPEYERARANLPHRVKARADYAKTEAGKEAITRGKKKYTEKYPIKRKAINMVNNAVRDGRLFRESCETCGSNKNVHAHHDDYAKPLNVRWLCAAHHRAWHDKNGEGLNGSGPINLKR